MDAKLKTKWVAALRSGDYKQGKGQLRNQENQFCCLGVLCEVAGIKHNGMSTIVDGVIDGYAPIRNIIQNARSASELMWMNDEGTPFSKIADYIEKHL